MTSQVPHLLETMNRTSGEVNALERHLSEAQVRYQKLLQQWSRLYEDLRANYGTSIDRVKPYFDAAQVFNGASQRVNAVVREFSAAASQHSQAKVELRSIEVKLAYGAHKVQLDREQQDGLSRATVKVLRCQQERDRREQEYAKVLREYQEAHEALEGWKSQIGESTIKRTLPCFRLLQQHQNSLADEQQRINSLTERAQAAKSGYNHAMRELDRINVAVHEARKSNALAAKMASETPEPKAPEQAPEASPEPTCESQDGL